MFVKQIFEVFEHFENRKRVTLTRPAIAGHLKTAIMRICRDKPIIVCTNTII